MKQTLIFIGLLGLILIVGIFLARRPQAPPTSSPEPTSEPSPVEPINADASAVLDLLLQQPDIPAGQLSLQVVAQTDTYLKADLDHTYPEAVAGWYVIATKNDVGWQLVYYGKDLPTCTDIDQWQVPEYIADQCLDEVTDNIVNLSE